MLWLSTQAPSSYAVFDTRVTHTDILAWQTASCIPTDYVEQEGRPTAVVELYLPCSRATYL